LKITKWNGKPISKPGWYSGIPIERYHSAGMCDGPAVSSTDLRTCWSKSRAHMFAFWAENPKRIERPTSRAMILGSAAHHLFLGELSRIRWHQRLESGGPAAFAIDGGPGGDDR